MVRRTKSLTLPPAVPEATKAQDRPVPATTKAQIGITRDFDIQKITTYLKMASDPTRLQILRLLMDGERSVTAICVELGGLSQPAVSHHLALLRVGGFVDWQRAGKHNHYRLAVRSLPLCRLIGDLGESMRN